MSFVARLWNTIRRPVRYVGRDLEGNKFFEARAPNDPSYTKRTVQYFEEEEVWRYISGGKRLPIQWSAWLTHTRKEPPTIEELEADIRRQLRLSANVARIEARDAAEAAQMLQMRQQDARLALADASAQARGVPAPGPAPAASQTEAAGTEAEAPAARNVRDAGGAVVRPPSFLTPSKPRKARASPAPFALPALEEAAASEQRGPAARPAEGAAPSPWISKPDETESWTPRAVRRG